MIFTFIISLDVFYFFIYTNKEGPLLNFGISILAGLILYLYILIVELIAGKDYSKIRKKITD